MPVIVFGIINYNNVPINIIVQILLVKIVAIIRGIANGIIQ